MNELTFCFIFARGGSKGLPGKNMLPINRMPLIGHSIEIAKISKKIDKVFISTDCKEIAHAGDLLGAEVINRPLELASDTASEWDAWQHAIYYVEQKYGYFTKFISLPATAPCRRATDVERCLNLLDEDVDIVVTTTKSQRSPWFNMVTTDSMNRARLVNNGEVFTRRQDAPMCHDMTTVAYVSRPEFIKRSKGIWDGIVRAVDVPSYSAIDIDTFYDYTLAKLILETPGLIKRFEDLEL